MRLKIHNHPQKEFYESEADWVPTTSQGHWRPGNNMPSDFPMLPIGLSTADPKIAHTHFDFNFPVFAEINSPLLIKSTIKLFHTAGRAGSIYSPLGQIRDIIYEDTGTSTPPLMIGDPMGIKQWNASFIFDPELIRPTFPPTRTVPKHGWFGFDAAIKTFYDNGDSVQTEALRVLYSMIDPNEPEVGIPDAGLQNGTAVAATNTRFTFPPETGLKNIYGNQMGQSFATMVGYFPLAPIDTKWVMEGFFYSYARLEGVPSGVFKFPDGTLSLRRDPDIHNGIPGVDIITPQHFQGATSFSRTPIVLDPSLIGPGKHKIAAFWQEPDGQGNDVTAIFAYDLVVGDSVPVPTRVPVPNLVGMNNTQSNMALMSVGLRLGEVTKSSDPTRPADIIIGQFPPVGDLLSLGSTVNIVVSTGPVITTKEIWKPEVPTFMRLYDINGKPTQRWQICGVNNSVMMDDCIELDTIPDFTKM